MRYAPQARFEDARVIQVRLDPPRAAVKVCRPAVGIAFFFCVNLRHQTIEDRHLVAARQEKIDEMGADESGSAGHKRVFTQGYSP
jgi:hypothetical protein